MEWIAVGLLFWGVVNALIWPLRGGERLTGFLFGVIFGPLATVYALLTLGDRHAGP